MEESSNALENIKNKTSLMFVEVAVKGPKNLIVRRKN